MLALRFLSGLESEESIFKSYCIGFLIRFVVYPYRNTGFEYGKKKEHHIGDKIFPSILENRNITSFIYIRTDDWAYHDVGEYEDRIQTVCAELIMKRICFYFCNKLEYEYNRMVLCNWTRNGISASYSYTMIPDRISHKK